MILLYFRNQRASGPVLNIFYHDIISNLWWSAIPDEICYNLFHFLDYSARDMNYARQIQ